MKKQVILLCAAIGFAYSLPVSAETDYSTDIKPYDNSYKERFSSRKHMDMEKTAYGETKHVQITSARKGIVRLKRKKKTNEHYSSGEIVFGNLNSSIHAFYSITLSKAKIKIPEGTSIKFYAMTDYNYTQEGYIPNWQEIRLGQTLPMAKFDSMNTGPCHNLARCGWNFLKVKAFLETDNPSITPVLQSLTFEYNADFYPQKINLLQNTFDVKNTPEATIKITIYGSNFEEDQEEVYFHNLSPAKSVQYIDSETLVAEMPISELSAGTYTVVVRNKKTGRIGATDGEPVESTSPVDKNDRVVLKGEAPEISFLSPISISYVDGGTFYIYGKNFTSGSQVQIRSYEISQNAITVLSDSKIKVDVTSTITTWSGWEKNTNLTVRVETPDLQEAEYTGFQIY